ncbi:CIC11C00000003474 [Sungouiella intermedia]|uniref:CIC11C00000003474 n=1 Tax=Sungouiella intermedia TaxID=45354 RepID=A0A1L0D8Q2_9ASCO|nr:CIC11C00000003474 [[Candida] intermedia]
MSVPEKSNAHEVDVETMDTPQLSHKNKNLEEEKLFDNSKQFVIDRENLYKDISDEEIKRTVRKNDWILLPVLFFTCTMGAVDKVSLSTAAIYGLRTDTHLHGQQYSWLGSIIFIGSLVGVWPVSFLLQRFPLGKALATASFCWSVLTLLLAACNNYASLVSLRFLMGIFETAIVPGATLMIGRFYLKKEQPVRLGIVFMFASSVINGFLSWLVGNFGDSLPKWKYLFLLTGSVSVAWSIFILFFLPNSPMNAVYLTDREKYIMVQRVLQNKTGVETTDFKWYQAREAVLDIKAYIIFFFNVAINIPNGGLSTFSGIIIHNLGFDSKQSSLMTIPTGVVASLATITFNYFSGRLHNKRCIIAITSLLLPICGAAICYGVKRNHVGPQLLGLYLMYFYFSSYVTMISLSQANTGGNTKKAVTYGINYLGYATGALIGPQTFRASQAPKYTGGFISMLGAYCACIFFAVIYWIVCTVENKRKTAALLECSAIEAEVGHLDDETLYSDITDKEKRDFMYTK